MKDSTLEIWAMVGIVGTIVAVLITIGQIFPGLYPFIESWWLIGFFVIGAAILVPYAIYHRIRYRRWPDTGEDDK